MITFNGHPGIKWNRTKATDPRSTCLPAFETQHAPPKFLAWFASAPDKSNTAIEELGSVALELIRRYAVFEMYHTNGYSIDAHITSLRAVMPSVTSGGRFGLIGLLGKLGICRKELGARPEIPNRRLEPWAGTDEDFDESEIEAPEQPDYMSSNLLLSEELKLHDQSVKRVDEGLAGMDDEGPNGYADIDNEAASAVEALDDEFRCSLRSQIEEGNLDEEVTAPMFEELAVPKLCEPVILNGPTFTKRAKAYARRNIWQRQLMSLSDRQLELRRVNALMIAAQYRMEFLLKEQEQYEREITELQMKHEKLREVWQGVEEELKKRDELRAQKEQLLATVSGLESNCVSGTFGSTRFSSGSVGGRFSAPNECSSSYMRSYGVSAPFAPPFSSSQSPRMLPRNGSSSGLPIQRRVASDGWRGIPTLNTPRDNISPLQLQQPKRMSSVALSESTVYNSASID